MIVMDLEWNYGVVANGETVLGKNLRFEIIEIGAVKVNADGSVKKTFDRLIKPQVHPIIKKKVVELTGITESKLANERSFPEIWKELSDWMEQEREIIFWGNCDRSVLLSNLLYYGIDGGEALKLYDLQALYDFTFLPPKKERQQTALSTALNTLELVPYGQYHSAIADAVNAAKILQELGGVEFVFQNQPKLLQESQKKMPEEPEGELVLERRFYAVTNLALLKQCLEPDMEKMVTGPVTEVMPGFYRNHKKIWVYRSCDMLFKVTSRSKPSQSGKGHDYVIRVFKIEEADLDKLYLWSKKAQTALHKKYPRERTSKTPPILQENFISQRNRKRGQ